MNFLRRLFRRRRQTQVAGDNSVQIQTNGTLVLDLSDNPLDPHGDGTLRPGDPIFEAAMRGESTFGVRRPDGKWDVSQG